MDKIHIIKHCVGSIGMIELLDFINNVSNLENLLIRTLELTIALISIYRLLKQEKK
jgi:hypothetical protein